MFKIANTTITTALTSGATFTVAYPSGTDEGTFRGAVGHKIVTESNDVYSSPANFTLSFGASNITVTEVSMLLALKSNGKLDLTVQLEEIGENDGDPTLANDQVRVHPLMTARINLGAPDVLDANGIIVSQDLTAAGVFSSSVTAAVAIAAGALAGTMDVPRCLQAAWTTTSVLTVTGTDEFGDVIAESSASGTSFTGKKAFKTVTDVSVTIDVTSLTVGTTDVLGLPVFIEGISQIQHVFEDGAQLAKDENLVRVDYDLDEVELLAADLVSVPCPVAGTIKRMMSMVGIAIGTGGTLSLKVNNTAVDGLALVVANSAAAGVVDEDTPTAGHASTVVAVDDEIEIVPDSAFATTGSLYGYIEIEPSESAKVAQGVTIVAGVDTEPIALTGDVRGTIDPLTVMDGGTVVELVALLADPSYKGRDNFAG